MASGWNFRVKNGWNERGWKQFGNNSVKWDHSTKFMDYWWRKDAQCLMETSRRYWSNSVYSISGFLLVGSAVWSPCAPQYLYAWKQCICPNHAAFFPIPQLEISVVYVKLWLWKHLLHLRRYVRVRMLTTSLFFVVCVEGGQISLNWKILALAPPDLKALIIWAGIFQTLSVSHSTHSLVDFCKNCSCIF